MQMKQCFELKLEWFVELMQMKQCFELRLMRWKRKQFVRQ
jgi:hypothetical protein